MGGILATLHVMKGICQWQVQRKFCVELSNTSSFKVTPLTTGRHSKVQSSPLVYFPLNAYY